MARPAHRNSEKNTHTQMAKVVYAKPTEGGNWGFNTDFVELDEVEEYLEQRKQEQNRDE